jgi:WD40 repeat protein
MTASDPAQDAPGVARSLPGKEDLLNRVIADYLDALERGPPRKLGPPAGSRRDLPLVGASLGSGRRWVALIAGEPPNTFAVAGDLENPDAPLRVRSIPWCHSTSVSRSGRYLAAGVHHGTHSLVWDLEAKGVEPCFRHPGPSSRVLFSPDDRFLAVSNATEYVLFERGTWTQRWSLPRLDPGVGGPLAFSPDGQTLAVTVWAREVRLLDVASGRELANLQDPSRRIKAQLAFSPDGTRLAVAHIDGEVQVWDLRLLRQELAAMGLDWDRPQFAPEDKTRRGEAGEIDVDLGELRSAR